MLLLQLTCRPQTNIHEGTEVIDPYMSSYGKRRSTRSERWKNGISSFLSLCRHVGQTDAAGKTGMTDLWNVQNNIKKCLYVSSRRFRNHRTTAEQVLSKSECFIVSKKWRKTEECEPDGSWEALVPAGKRTWGTSCTTEGAVSGSLSAFHQPKPTSELKPRWMNLFIGKENV